MEIKGRGGVCEREIGRGIQNGMCASERVFSKEKRRHRERGERKKQSETHKETGEGGERERDRE